MAIFDKVKEFLADLKGVNLFTFLRENKIYARLRKKEERTCLFCSWDWIKFSNKKQSMV